MRVLQIVKTADGAQWAAAQAGQLVRLGVEVHVALPCLQGRAVAAWKAAGAMLHATATDISPKTPWSIPATLRELRELVAMVRPDLIHSHFVTSTILLRLALGAHSKIPRLFQVPGPLHLERSFWRNLEISTASACDSWIASSRCILGHYRTAGIPEHRLYLSYYGTRTETCNTQRTGALRQKYGIAGNMFVVGNANFIYPPKRFLGQRRGLKAHEDVIDALALVIRQRPDVVGVLIGGTFTHGEGYERGLRQRARSAAGDRILMPGYVPMDEIRRMWPDFDLAVHVPTSENCGGVIEPMLAGVPTIAGRVGGLLEVVHDGLTGTTVPIRQPAILGVEILRVLDSLDRSRDLAKTARTLVTEMFNVERTAREVRDIYEHVLHLRPQPPVPFDPSGFLAAQQQENAAAPISG